MKTILAAVLLLIAIPASSQTFCSTSRDGRNTTCLGENNSMTTITRDGHGNATAMDERGNLSFYNNGTIIDAESQASRDERRRSDERRRDVIYGEERRHDSRSRPRDGYNERR